MKIFVTGANGLLGQQLVHELLARGYAVIATGKGASRLPVGIKADFEYHDLDITDGNRVNQLVLALKPDIIVHAAAMTQVDACEENKIECWNVNVTATRFLVDAAREINARFILVSTDFVFDGLNGPYAEDDGTNPVNYYGSSKLGAEKAVMESGLKWTIVRTVLVTGNSANDTRPNIITWVRDKLEKGEKIKMVNDQFRTPTFVEDLATGIRQVIEKKAEGIFHLSGKDSMTPFQIAVETARSLGLDEKLIEQTDSATISHSAPRPSRTGFIIQKARTQLGYEPHSFSDSLSKMFTRQ